MGQAAWRQHLDDADYGRSVDTGRSGERKGERESEPPKESRKEETSTDRPTHPTLRTETDEDGKRGEASWPSC